MRSTLKKMLGGVDVQHCKNTQDETSVFLPTPEQVVIVMSQHMGPPCQVQTKVGDNVKVGQVIGDSQALMSAPIHASVSGTVKSIEEILMPNGARVSAVIIVSDGKQTLHEGIAAPKVNDKESFVAAIRASGLVGLGGAGFPAHIKLKTEQPVDTLIVNAAECEPYITSDYRTIMEDTQNILDGIATIMKYVGIKHCVIGIEDNKPGAIEKLNGITSANSDVTVFPLKVKYPKGAEKVIIYETTGRVVPEGKLPSDAGVIVSNVASVAFIGQYIKDGIPLVSRRVTVDGGAVASPKNVIAPIGVSIKTLIEFCGGYKSEARKLLYGGPMMGTVIRDDSYPILKNNNAILAFNAAQAEMFSESACIRCGRCVRSCPLNLMPLRIEDCFNRDDMDGLERYKVNLCVECGCCAYVCPAKRNLVQTFRLAKAHLRSARTG